jgi:hypothetical protein
MTIGYCAIESLGRALLTLSILTVTLIIVKD